MIERDGMMKPMLLACPSFQQQWDKFCDEYKEESELPQYIAISELVRHVIGLYEAGDHATVERVFEVVERWHIEGDWYVKEAATVGFLEDLQNEGLHKTTKPQEFERFLRPESRRWWKKVEDFWEHGKLLTDD